MRVQCLAALVAMSACDVPRQVARSLTGQAATTSAVGAPPNATVMAPADERSGWDERFEASALDHDRPTPAVLYTWTSRSQAQALRRHRRLLTRHVNGEGTYALFDQRLQKRVGGETGDQFAEFLSSIPMRHRRFAWINGWATSLGGFGYDYGPVLVRVTLRSDALIARFDAKAVPRWTFLDLAGAPKSENEAWNARERIAAVYHVFEDGDDGWSIGVSFREFVLCNESMIATYEFNTPALAADTATWIALLTGETAEKVQADVAARELARTMTTWRGASPSRARAAGFRLIGTAYVRNLAFVDPAYRLDSFGQQHLLKTLRMKSQVGEPLHHKVTVKMGDPLPKPRTNGARG